ncbi:MAG: pro-sigmaK processing inhibitor BofA family protein [Methanoregula sp.]|jgi:inhibitor of the pro-sigma K processing machinery|uniref:pro-sigmaK processing inhibitor BofA family protein n=1 Tax=Methanoregula sp. TaxID=2052170 RepID=UPI003D119BAC
MTDILLAIVLIIAVIAIAWYLVKKLAVLAINAVLGLICLFIVNFFHIMQWIGKPDLGYTLATVIICAVGGLPGVLILILLNMFGITV